VAINAPFRSLPTCCGCCYYAAMLEPDRNRPRGSLTRYRAPILVVILVVLVILIAFDLYRSY